LGGVAVAYFAARNGHINLDEIKIDLKKLRQFFFDVYSYFKNQQYFKKAFFGLGRDEPPLMVPSPSTFWGIRMFIQLKKNTTGLIK
jgi:hypothetical protein